MMVRMKSHVVVLASLVTALMSTPGQSRRPKNPETIFLGGERFPAPTVDSPRVLLIGDSNFFGPLGHSLRRSFMRRGDVVRLRGKPSSGLARPEFFDWFREARRLVDEVRPDLVIVMLGANDVQRITWPHFRDRIYWRDEQSWRRAYHGRYRAFARFLSDRVPEVIMLSPTNRGWASARAAVTRVREEQRRATRDLPNVHWVDMFPLSSNADGSWLRAGRRRSGSRIQRVYYRQPDRIHLTTAGGELVGERLLARLAELPLRFEIPR